MFRSFESVYLNIVVLGELLSGFRVGSREEKNRRELRRFLSFGQVSLVPLKEETAQHYASIHATLKKAGMPIPTNDLWIAASALEHGVALYSYDSHFQAVEGLHVGASPLELAIE